jgi:ABC-2 type transport system ATP-binding protein
VISVQHLVKHYRVHERPAGLLAALRSTFRRDLKTVRAVDDVSFVIDEGERVGFLGPNGAGKTTTLKVLAGLLHPTSGDVRVLGMDPRTRPVELLRSIMLVTGQKQQLLWDLPPVETFELNRAIYDVSRVDFARTLDELVTLLRLEDIMKKPARQLSLGERMKCELAAALVHSPKVLFLDEPTIGLDVSMQSVVRAFIKSYSERHRAAVLLTSHYMEDVAALTPRVLVIDRGKISFDGGLSDLVRRTRPDKLITLTFSAAVDAPTLRAVVGPAMESSPLHAVLQVEASTMKDIVARALAQLPIVDFKVEDAPLEEVLADFFASSGSKDGAVASDGDAAS